MDRGTGAKQCVSMQNTVAANGDNVQISDCSAAPVFRVPTNRQGWLKLDDDPTKCLSVEKADLNDGGNVHIWDCMDVPEDKWYLMDVPSYGVGTITINDKWYLMDVPSYGV